MKKLIGILGLFIMAYSYSYTVSFTNNICIKPSHGYHYTLCNEYYFYLDDTAFEIPQNFDTDLASIPRLAWPYISPAHSQIIAPAIVHDYFYRNSCYLTRKESDIIFYDMLRANHISYINSQIMYWAVRMFGWRSYRECRNEL